MKRFQSILCASLLTLAMSSAALAGNISGRSGNISGAPTTAAGNISGISGLTDEAYGEFVGLLTVLVS
jgi:hypothetical protein